MNLTGILNIVCNPSNTNMAQIIQKIKNFTCASMYMSSFNFEVLLGKCYVGGEKFKEIIDNVLLIPAVKCKNYIQQTYLERDIPYAIHFVIGDNDVMGFTGMQYLTETFHNVVNHVNNATSLIQKMDGAISFFNNSMINNETMQLIFNNCPGVGGYEMLLDDDAKLELIYINGTLSDNGPCAFDNTSYPLSLQLSYHNQPNENISPFMLIPIVGGTVLTIGMIGKYVATLWDKNSNQSPEMNMDTYNPLLVGIVNVEIE